MIKNLRIKNFKSWKDTGDLRLAPLTAFFGTNSSGKTSLLQMLLLLKQTVESADRALVLRTSWADNDYLNLGTIPELIHYGSDRMEFCLEWDLENPIKVNENKIQSLYFQTEIVKGAPHYIEHMRYVGDGRVSADMKRKSSEKYNLNVEIDGTEAKRPQGRPRTVPAPEKCYGFPNDARLIYQNAGFLSDFELAFQQLFEKVYHLGPLREYPQRTYSWAGEQPGGVGLKGEKAIPALLARAKERVYHGKNALRTQLEKRIASWLFEMGLVHSFRTERVNPSYPDYRVLVKRTKNAAEVPITDIGFGVSQVLPVLVLCYYCPEGSTLVLEQPEIHLHPSVQSTLADVFIDVMINRNVQIVLESHSEHLLRRLQRRIAEEKLSTNQTAIYFCNLDDGVSRAEPLEIDALGNIRNWPQDFFGDLTGDLFETAQAGIKRQLANGAK